MSKYKDTTAILQIVGNVYNNPSLLDQEDKYNITDDDFPDEFHRTVFGAIYKVYELGAKTITLENLSDFLASRPKAEGIYKANNGEKWLLEVSEKANPLSFDYYYGRLKKMTLLRAFESYGIDVSDIYDPDNILDSKKKQEQEDRLDSSSLEEIAEIVNRKIEDIRLRYVDDVNGEASQAADGILDLIQSLKNTPEVGAPLYGSLINTVHRGARLGKFYVRSAATGVGKTRALMADACYTACNKIYDVNFGWIKTGRGQPALFIATEQDLTECQTLALAFLSAVPEDHILYGKYEDGEEERVLKAAEILKESPLYIETIPDFSLQDIENLIKKNIRDHDVKLIFFDYIHTSIKILSEITQRSGGVKIREDNVLFMLSDKLKSICVQYGVFIESATQLNGSYVESETPDQNLLRGAKSIADRIDYGAIILKTTPKDLEALEPILSANVFEPPALKISVYKNRRGRYAGIFLWAKADLGTCRINPMFATDFNYDLIPINDMKIMIEEPGAFETDD